MTSLLNRPVPTSGGYDPAHRRPLALVAALGGAAAALGPLTVALAVGVIGWFVTDAGAHGSPSDGLRAGALAWLMAHGSGVRVEGVAVTVVPLGLTLVAVWSAWRLGHRVGDSVSGHGPDADAIEDGERDWTVPAAVFVFAGAYAVVALVTLRLVGAEWEPSTARVLSWVLLLALLVATPAIAVGSGRAAIWAQRVPDAARAAGATAVAVLLAHVALAALALATALALDFGSAANVLSRLHADAGDATLFTLVTAAVTPNAVLFSGAYLLGPGFTVGVGTLVSPTVVSLGPVPAFPLLAALPDNGPAPTWVVALMALPVLAAAVAAARVHRRFPTVRWDVGGLQGCVGGALAGVAFAALTLVAGGSVGPGRMRDVAPYSFDVLVHGIAAFGIGGLLGGLAMTWFTRRRLLPSDDPTARPSD